MIWLQNFKNTFRLENTSVKNRACLAVLVLAAMRSVNAFRGATFLSKEEAGQLAIEKYASDRVDQPCF